MNINKLLTPDRVSYNLNAKNKEESIDELIELLYQDGVVKDKSVFKNAVMKREEEFSTGIGHGIGIPHGKSDAVSKEAIALGISKNGIEFDSMDGEPANLIFLIAVPEESDNAHLQILSYISRKLMHGEVREKLMKAENYNGILEAF